MTITEQLDAVLDKADALYKSGDFTVTRKVEEIELILATLIDVVKQLDPARPDHRSLSVDPHAEG